jgi:glucose-1-phosphate thymidylyltransferase
MTKGVILAGGMGTRLRPFTHVINKHFLPIYDKPLIYYPLLAMRDAGIKEVMLTCNKDDLPSFQKLLGTGSEFGLTITYATQDGPKGIADALGLAEKFADGSKVAVMLGDNLYTDHDQIRDSVAIFENDRGARLFLKEVTDPERFGVAEIKDGNIISIIEKPAKPLSNLAVTGLYLYDPDVFDIVKVIKPSARGELEITDVNNHYVKNGTAKYEVIKGEWVDAGTFDSFVRASVMMLQKNKGFPVDFDETNLSG